MLPRAPRPPRSGSARARAPPGRPGGRAAGRRGGSPASAARRPGLAPRLRDAARRLGARARSTRRAGRGRRAQALALQGEPAREGLRREPAADGAAQAGARRRRRSPPARSRPNAATAARGLSGRGWPFGTSGRHALPVVERRGETGPRASAAARAASMTPATSSSNGPASALQARSASASAAEDARAPAPIDSSLAAQHRDRVLFEAGCAAQLISTPGRSSGGNASRASSPS